jgi:hypothetical protein
VLRGAGWTVQGLLLPGFGRDFATLPDRHHGDWVAAIERRWLHSARTIAP